MKIIGLTGNIGSGKSTVSRRLGELGAEILDTDQVSRDVVAPGTPGLKEIVNAFGPEVLTPEGGLNREKMGSIVFAQPEARKRLETIIHPRIKQVVGDRIKKYKSGRGNSPALVIEVPLLFESGWHCYMDEVWLVTVDPAVQLQRIMSRDKLSGEQALSRMNSQMPQEQKIKLAQKIIDNSGPREDTMARVDALWQELMKSNNR